MRLALKPALYFSLTALTGCIAGSSTTADTSAAASDALTATVSKPSGGPSAPTTPVSQSAQDHDNGTRLGASPVSTTAPCADGSALLTETGSITSTGSVDSVIITASVDGGDFVQLGVIEPQAFVHDGRNKTAPFNVSLGVSPGQHDVKLCFTQSGSQGRKPKQTCQTGTFVVTCDGGEGGGEGGGGGESDGGGGSGDGEGGGVPTGGMPGG